MCSSDLILHLGSPPAHILSAYNRIASQTAKHQANDEISAMPRSTLGVYVSVFSRSACSRFAQCIFVFESMVLCRPSCFPDLYGVTMKVFPKTENTTHKGRTVQEACAMRTSGGQSVASPTVPRTVFLPEPGRFHRSKTGQLAVYPTSG